MIFSLDTFSSSLKKGQVVLAIGAALFLTGCNDFSTPEGVVETAYKALSTNDAKLYGKTLTGEAKAKYGDLEGMMNLQRRLKGLDLAVGEVQPGVFRRAGELEYHRYSTVVVTEKPAAGAETAARPVLEALVVCYVDYVEKKCDYRGSDYGNRYPGGDCHDVQGRYGAPGSFEESVRFCSIYELKFL